MQRWVRELAGALAPATVAKAVNVLSLILAVAVRSQLLAVNPCVGLMLPSNRRAGDSILTLTREEFAGNLLPAVPTEHRAIVSMAAGCGLRWGECAGLPWDSIDLDSSEVHVRQVAVELYGRLDLRPFPKTRAGRRTVPMPGFLLAALRAHLNDGSADGLAFGTRAGTPMRRSNFRRQVWAPAVLVRTATGAPPPRPAAQLRDLTGVGRRTDQRGEPPHGSRADQHDPQPVYA